MNCKLKEKNTALTEIERYELLVLISIYQIGQLRKSEGLAEAVRRQIKLLYHHRYKENLLIT
ncbi:hypothetical protein FBB35_24140 [Nostoc sp. TCL240-02]|nr:hypothetical protein FBB35_24140 [Nostoc sp. TCL240-02]